MKVRDTEGLSFDDVLLVPRRSENKSRFDGSIDLSVHLTRRIKLRVPFISAAMDTITDVRMANELNRLGGLGIIHRFMPDSKALTAYRQIKGHCVLTIGLGEKGMNRLVQVMEYDDVKNPDAVHIDVAYAWTPFMVDFVKEIKSRWPDLDVIVGSVATGDAVYELGEAGVDAIRVGVGPGSQCSTRIQTGNGVPQLTALMEAHRASEQLGHCVSIICDGGVKNPGDCVKALAAGADVIMTGWLFAGTEETPGEVVSIDGQRIKLYRGMSSLGAQKDWKGEAKSVEGEMTHVPYKGKLADVLEGIVCNVLSGFAYQGVFSIQELQEYAEFINISSAGMHESRPRK